MATIRLESIHTVEDLTDLGSFSHVKKSISQQIGFTIKAASRHELLHTILAVRQALKTHKKDLQPLLADSSEIRALGKFNKVKQYLSGKLGIKLRARGWDELYDRLTTVAMIFSSPDKSQAKLSLSQKIQYFDQNKSESFIASSKLEGLDIGLPKSNMKEILHKYKQLAIANG